MKEEQRDGKQKRLTIQSDNYLLTKGEASMLKPRTGIQLLSMITLLLHLLLSAKLLTLCPRKDPLRTHSSQILCLNQLKSNESISANRAYLFDRGLFSL